MTAVGQQVVLEPAAQALVEATADPRGLVDLGPEGAREVLDDMQAAPVDKLPVDEEWVTGPAAVGYATAQWLVREGAARGLDAGRMAVAGESVGGSMTAELALMAEERGGGGRRVAAASTAVPLLGRCGTRPTRSDRRPAAERTST